jgi:hypothetical protein
VCIDPGDELWSETDDTTKGGIGILKSVVLEGRSAQKDAEGPCVYTLGDCGSLGCRGTVLRARNATRTEGMGGCWVERGVALVDKAEEEPKGCGVSGRE